MSTEKNSFKVKIVSNLSIFIVEAMMETRQSPGPRVKLGRELTAKLGLEPFGGDIARQVERAREAMPLLANAQSCV